MINVLTNLEKEQIKRRLQMPEYLKQCIVNVVREQCPEWKIDDENYFYHVVETLITDDAN
jgi:hypothetical protein